MIELGKECDGVDVVDSISSNGSRGRKRAPGGLSIPDEKGEQQCMIALDKTSSTATMEVIPLTGMTKMELANNDEPEVTRRCLEELAASLV